MISLVTDGFVGPITEQRDKHRLRYFVLFRGRALRCIHAVLHPSLSPPNRTLFGRFSVLSPVA